MQRKKSLLIFGIIAVVIIGIAVSAIVLIPHWRAARSRSAQGPLADVISTRDSTATIEKTLDGHDSTGEYGLKVGQAGHIGSLEITVVQAQVTNGAAGSPAVTVVSITVKNKGNSAASIDPAAWSAIDRKNGDVPRVTTDTATDEAPQAPAGQTISMQLSFEGADIGRIVYSSNNASQEQLTWRVP